MSDALKATPPPAAAPPTIPNPLETLARFALTTDALHTGSYVRALLDTATVKGVDERDTLAFVALELAGFSGRQEKLRIGEATMRPPAMCIATPSAPPPTGERTAGEERADVVAWFRRSEAACKRMASETMSPGMAGDWMAQATAHGMNADAIARGDHIGSSRSPAGRGK